MPQHCGRTTAWPLCAERGAWYAAANALRVRLSCSCCDGWRCSRYALQRVKLKQHVCQHFAAWQDRRRCGCLRRLRVSGVLQRLFPARKKGEHTAAAGGRTFATTVGRRSRYPPLNLSTTRKRGRRAGGGRRVRCGQRRRRVETTRRPWRMRRRGWRGQLARTVAGRNIHASSFFTCPPM